MQEPIQEPKLQFFNLSNLIEHLNSSLRNKENVIELQDFEKRDRLFSYRLGNKRIDVRGLYPLTQRGDGRGIDGILGYDSEVEIGRIFVEKGFVDLDEGEDCEVYEILELRLKSPLELTNKNIIPKCKIRLYRETCEWAEPFQEREDKLMYGIFPIGDDLSRFLPDAYFTI